MRNPKILVVERNAALADQVREATAALRPRPGVVACTQVAMVAAEVAENGPFEVLVAGTSVLTAPGLVSLRRIRVEHPGMSVVMAAARRPEATFRDIIRVGAVDALVLPVKNEALAEAISEAIEVSLGEAIASAAMDSTPGQRGAGEVLTIVSVTGGSGKTFLATNVAYYLHTFHRRRVCVMDLDLQFGELATALRIHPQYTVADALAHDEAEEGELADRIGDMAVLHDTGIFVLAGPSDPRESDSIETYDVARLLKALRARFDAVIVDTPASLSGAVLTAVDLSDEIIAVGTLDLPSVRNMGILISTLGTLGVPDANVQLILNKVEKDVGIEAENVAKFFAQGFAAAIPYGREVSRSVNLGMPVLAFLPDAPVSKALLAGLNAMRLPVGDVIQVASDEKPGRRWRGRRDRAGS